MNASPDLITVLALIVAIVVIIKLRSALGRRTTDDEARIERKIRAEQQLQQERAKQEKVVTLPRRDRESVAAPSAQAATTLADAHERIKAFAGGNAEVERGLIEIGRKDSSFDVEHFLGGAKQAYEMIVTAFAEGNRKTLKELLSREVYDGFSEAIAEREGRGEIVDQSFVGISKADLVEAELRGNQAHVSVKFVSQLINATRDKAGTIISGDPQKIRDVTDIWTFARELNSRDPNWRLVATQAPN